MDTKIHRLVKSETLAEKISLDSSKNALANIDLILSENNKSRHTSILSIDTLKKAKSEIEALASGGYSIAKTAVLLPVGLWGFKEGLQFPDLDISTLGIGNHRFFLFHSSLGVVLLRHLYNQWIQKNELDAGFINRVKKKVSGTILGTYAVGVGVHLMIDVFQPKSVVFPFFGSLAEGTLVDDNIWLLGNSLWAFKIGHDIFTIAIGDELKSVKKYIADKFGPNFNYNDLEKV